MNNLKYLVHTFVPLYFIVRSHVSEYCDLYHEYSVEQIESASYLLQNTEIHILPGHPEQIHCRFMHQILQLDSIDLRYETHTKQKLNGFRL